MQTLADQERHPNPMTARKVIEAATKLRSRHNVSDEPTFQTDFLIDAADPPRG
jgi:hypothetical protein